MNKKLVIFSSLAIAIVLLGLLTFPQGKPEDYVIQSYERFDSPIPLASQVKPTSRGTCRPNQSNSVFVPYRDGSRCKNDR